jgi:hypothetical protein
MHALQPDSTDLYVNVRCLKRGTFVTRSRAEQNKQQQQSVHKSTTTTHKKDSPRSSSPSDDYVGVSNAEHKDDDDDDDDPLFTVTAASSISKSFSDYGDDRSSTTELEAVTYRLRKALSPSSSKVSSDSGENESDNSRISAESFVALGQETMDSRVPATVASAGDSAYNHNAGMLGSFMAVQLPAVAAAEEVDEDDKKDEDDDKKKPAAATASTGSTSFQESVSSAPSSEEAREQFRRFMSKHVSPRK